MSSVLDNLRAKVDTIKTKMAAMRDSNEHKSDDFNALEMELAKANHALRIEVKKEYDAAMAARKAADKAGIFQRDLGHQISFLKNALPEIKVDDETLELLWLKFRDSITT